MLGYTKLWYAIQVHEGDTDLSDGTFDKYEAVKRMHEINERFDDKCQEKTCHISVVDADYDEAGQPHSKPFVIDILYDDDV